MFFKRTKESITIDDFSTITSNNNFVVNSNMDNYKNIDYIVDSKKAILDGMEIEMVKYTDSDSAKKVQDGQIDSFNLLKNTGAYEEKNKGSNYYRYVLVSNGYYMISVRVDDTLIFSKTALENKEIIEKIYDQFGY